MGTFWAFYNAVIIVMIFHIFSLQAFSVRRILLLRQNSDFVRVEKKKFLRSFANLVDKLNTRDLAILEVVQTSKHTLESLFANLRSVNLDLALGE